MIDELRVRAVAEGDLPAWESILREWLVPPEGDDHIELEIERRLEVVQSSIGAPTSPWFFVAEVDGEVGSEVVGMIGLETGEIDPELVGQDEAAAELISAFVRQTHVGRGVGTTLADFAEARAREHGCRSLVVVSGARHRERGYPFWTRRYGEPVRTDPDFWAPGAERVVWRASLTP